MQGNFSFQRHSDAKAAFRRSDAMSLKALLALHAAVCACRLPQMSDRQGRCQVHWEGEPISHQSEVAYSQLALLSMQHQQRHKDPKVQNG